MYIVADGSTFIGIDAGASLPRTRAGFAALNLKPGQLTALFLTHADQDHCRSLPLFDNAQIFLSQAEIDMITGRQTRMFGIFRNELPESYSALTDSQIVSFGNISVRAIATPGHTPGSMSYLVNDRFLFTGDTLRLKRNEAGLFSPRFFNMDEAAQKESIRQLARLSHIDYLCTGHHGITGNFEYAMEKWRQ